MLSKKLVLSMIFVAMFLGASFASASPNFLLILCDDLGYGDLGCYGHPHIKTPHLDKMANEGLFFIDCYASAPVCSSSRAGLMTGRTPNRTGVYDWIPNNHVAHLRKSETTIASLLKKKGYATAHSGKWHLNGKFNSKVQPQPHDHGFDHWLATQNNASPSHANPVNYVLNGEPVGPKEGYSCQIAAEEALRWMKQVSGEGKPFFMNVWLHEPHEPVASPEDLVAEYRSVARDENEAQYFANVANVDRAVGQLLNGLKDMGIDEDTLVFFTSDNGPETLNRYRGAKRSYGSPGPLRGMKLHVYEGGIRVPGILRWPAKIKKGRRVATPISGVDILPTFCELADVSLPTGKPLDGTSFLPVLEKQNLNRDVPLFWAYYRTLGLPKVAMRDGDWKLVAHWDGPEKPLGGNVNSQSMHLIKNARLTHFELYNLKNDKEETTDLAKKDPKRLKALSQALTKKFIEVQKEGPVWEFE